MFDLKVRSAYVYVGFINEKFGTSFLSVIDHVDLFKQLPISKGNIYFRLTREEITMSFSSET
jgi:hypothetical protein